MNNDDNSHAVKHKASIAGNTENNGTKSGVKIVVPLKYFCNFLEIIRNAIN